MILYSVIIAKVHFQCNSKSSIMIIPKFTAGKDKVSINKINLPKDTHSFQLYLLSLLLYYYSEKFTITYSTQCIFVRHMTTTQYPIQSQQLLSNLHVYLIANAFIENILIHNVFINAIKNQYSIELYIQYVLQYNNHCNVLRYLYIETALRRWRG